MIPNFKQSYCHQKEFLEKPCNFQMTEKLVRRPIKESVEGFDYPSIWTSKTYSILSYIVGGFVGSKSQMNNTKHNFSYDLSAAILNLLNPWKYEREKVLKKSDNFYNSTCKISSECYDKYIVKASHRQKMGFEWFGNYVMGFYTQYYNSSLNTRDFNCDEIKDFINGKSTMENSILVESVDVLDRVSVCGDETPKESSKHLINSVSKERMRQLSECSIESTDSESFIIFDSPNCSEENRSVACWKLENFDFNSEEEIDEDDDDDDDDDDEDDGDDDDSSCDEHDICSLNKDVAEANNKWLRNYKDIEASNEEGQRKVRFNDDVKINKIIAWDFAYRAARSGPWEQMALDRFRFRQKISQLSDTLTPILKKEHREKIYKKLYS